MRLMLKAVLKKITATALYSAAFGTIVLCSLPAPAVADGLLSDYAATPPLLSAAGDKPNVLVVLDNSNSMDENAAGQAVGSDKVSSKSEVARSAVKSLISTFNGKIRMGLMAYQQDTMSAYKLHNSFYDVSFDSTSYDSTFTGARDATTKRYREPKPSPAGEYVYYNVALPFYSNTNQGTAYCYSTTADFDNGSEVAAPSGNPSGGGPWDSYRCFSAKTGASDTLPASTSSSDESTEGWSSYYASYTFFPTDSDYAQSILDFGRFMAWKYVGDTWFVNTSPGKGYLHIPIADLDATQTAKLNTKLGTSQFSSNKPTDANYPLQNAGLTPLAGTLETANTYFTGGTLAGSEGGPASAVPTNSCGSADYVVLVTDGLPSTDDTGNAYSTTQAGINDVAAKAATLAGNGIKVYVVGFALPSTVNQTLLDQIAAAGGTTQAYYATNTATLNAALGSIFQNIMARTSSASNAAVVSNNNAGEGALYQALYNPELTRNNATTGVSSTVSWTGLLHAVFVDSYGYLREDSNGNHQLDNYATDKIISLKYDSTLGRTMLNRYTSGSASTPTSVTFSSQAELDDLIPIWDARDALAGLDNSTIVNQRAYGTAVSNTAASRYIFTWIDDTSTSPGSGTIGAVDSSEVLDFTASALASEYQYLGVNTSSAAQNIVDFVRGKEGITGFRSRSIDYDGDGINEVLRLGDIVHSTPVVVGIPNDGYDLLNGDYTYTTFRNHYKDRRQVTYVGANDGMLHAFNGGFWDNVNKRFLTTNGTETAHPLGAELWGYVPQALLPHLQWLTDPNYQHVYYVDGAPLVFDANIFTADTDHPGGWGTVLVVGMRFGGGPFTVDSDGDGAVVPGTDQTLRSSYVVMDITNPEVAPTLIAEISDSSLGFTTSKPTVVKERAPSSSGSWASPSVNHWYLVFGSGPDTLSSATSTQTAKVYAYQLDVGSRGIVSGYGPYDLGISNSFVGDMSTADWNTDFLDDGVYFGTVGLTSSSPPTETGRLMRFNLDTTTAASGGSPWSGAGVGDLLTPSQPFVSAPTFASDPTGRNWVFAGTGRLFVTADNLTTQQQSFYGVMEPVDAFGDRTWAAVTLSNLRDTTNIDVYTDSSISPTTLTTLSGTAIASFTDLKADIVDRGGWKLDFAPGNAATPITASERSLSSPARIAKNLLFTSYTPSSDSCSPEGTSAFWAVNYLTGTGSPYAAIGTSTVVNAAGAYAAVRTVDLGLGLTSTPLIHRGSGQSSSGNGGTALFNSSGSTGGGGNAGVLLSGSTGGINEGTLTLEGVTGGRQSWRELELQ